MRGLSTPALRHLLRPWLARPELGWTITWLLHALDVAPDGRARTCTDAVRAPAGWLRHRMGAWLDGHGQPLPSPGVAIAAAAAAVRDRADRDRADRDRHTLAAAAEQAFGQQIRAVAGKEYPALVATVMARQPPAAARLLPASAAEALTRQAIRAALHNPPDTDTIAAAIGAILAADASRNAVTP